MPAKKPSKTKRLVLLDSHAILHRAFHALPDDFTSKKTGEPTNALYGLVAMLIKMIADLNPDYIAAAYDLPEPTYRHVAFKEYKAGRAKTDDALVRQIERSRDIFKAFHIPVYEKAGYEADDILGTIVEQTKDSKDLSVVIASGDMDTLQLVSKKRVQVYTLKKGIRDTILYDENAVFERYGFKPTSLPDYKGLAGDPSDNIPGIAGIGAKTASTLIGAFGTVEKLYAALKKDPEAVKAAGVRDRVINLLTEGEEEALFSKMLGLINREVPVTFTLPEHTWRDGVQIVEILALFSELSFRTLALRAQELLGAAPEAASEEKKQTERIDPVELKKVTVALSMVDSSLADPAEEDVYEFADADTFSEAREVIFKKLNTDELTHVYTDIELPLVPVLERMERWGIGLDTAFLAELSVRYHSELEMLEKKILEEAGGEFNINSPKQLGEILFDKLELKPKNHKKTAGGARSTRESELEKLRDEHPIIEHLFEYRELQKLLSTYIDPLPEMVAEDGRVHTHFIQMGAATGRMASVNPNLQNIPIKTERGAAIRRAFVAAEGFMLVAIDYSQIELRVAAFLSQDEKLLEIFTSGEDIHTGVAAEVFGVEPKDVDKEMRRRAKVINFGILYGMGVSALRVNLDASRAEAERFYLDYFATFATLAAYLEESKQFAHTHGYSKTLFGRRRYFSGLTAQMPQVRAAAERMAMNAPIQGTQADIIKLAMVKIDAYLGEKNMRADVWLLLQVHDELVFEIREEKIREMVPILQHMMETILPLEQTKGVPLETHASVGKNWGEMSELEVRSEK